MHRQHSGTTDPRPSQREMKHGKLARELATEAMVLLKNEDGVLPLDLTKPFALFGGGAVKTVKGGIGSGDVNNRENISIYSGLLQAGAAITSEEWLSDYVVSYDKARLAWKEEILAEARTVDNPFDAYSSHPFTLPEGRKITKKDLQGAYAAVYVISRISGEGRDRRLAEGDYYLSVREREDLIYLSKQNIPVVLLINAGGPVELTDILEQAGQIKAILNISQPGQEGGYAVADVLLGHCAPGGRLTATWAKRYADYPCAENFGYLSGNLNICEYREGIFVGYRYFDSYGVAPLFPFGYGLSYTSFEMEVQSCQVRGTDVNVSVLVRNSGEYTGREVVQVYATLPQSGCPKEFHRLVGFGKTALLQPGESQTLTISIEQKNFASFSETLHAWILNAGAYGLWIGRHCNALNLAATLTVPQDTVIERTEAVFPGTVDFLDLVEPEAEWEGDTDWQELADLDCVPMLPFVPVEEKRKPYHAQSAEGSVEELIPLLFGNVTKGVSTLGSSGTRVPGSAGETTEALEDRCGLRSLIMADGPAGLRLRQSYEVDRITNAVYGMGVLASLENGFLEQMERHQGAETYYQYCTAFPVGTALAQTWDPALLRRFGQAVAAEMSEFSVDLWLAPGMNIQRNPLCGRNFEYFSEDPLLAGVTAAAITEGVQARGHQGVTLKHFACNNQEDNRMAVDAKVSERALREIYLRGFEIAVKRAAPASIMTSYNRINGVHTANSHELCTVVAREEWGFGGMIMTDWNTTVPKDGSVPWRCAAAGNDVIMPGSPEDEKNIRDAYRRGALSETAIRECARRVIDLIQKVEDKTCTAHN